MKKLLFCILLVLPCLLCMAGNSRWNIDAAGNIEWRPDSAHHDHIEMSGEKVSVILRWGVDEAGTFSEVRQLVFPMLRTIPNDTHASLNYRVAIDIPALITVDGWTLREGRSKLVRFDGCFHEEGIWRFGERNDSLSLSRVILPSRREAMIIERYELRNLSGRAVQVSLPQIDVKNYPSGIKSLDGPFVVETSSLCSGDRMLAPGEAVIYDIAFQGYKQRLGPLTGVDAGAEIAARYDFLNEISGKLVLESPDRTVDEMFRFAKIRATESIYKTAGGYMHSPGGEVFYAAIWANDEGEYANPLFPFIGYPLAIESALNCFRLFAGFMNPDYNPIPCSIIAEGTDIWNAKGDRGDMAMLAYGASRFALEYADRAVAEELWPFIEWNLEYCRRHLSPEGVVMSDTDELEERFPSGDANLNTSCMYYDALLSADMLSRQLGKGATAYPAQAKVLRKNIEKFFGREMEGFHTYRYFDGNDVLRAWICMPLTVDIFDRTEGTAEALMSPYLWTGEGLLTQQGEITYWDRATLYALRGLFRAGKSDLANDKLHYFSDRRLLGDHVPYVVEAWPEGAQRQLSAESALYCRVITEGLFGFRPTGFRSFELRPSLPSGWDKVSLRHVRAFACDFDVELSRLPGDKIEVKVISEGKVIRRTVKNHSQTALTFRP